MKTLIKTSVLFTGFFMFAALAKAEIKKINITYSQLLLPVDRQGFAIPQALVGGYVDFEGKAPAYVSLLIGGQIYNQPTNHLGYFSFMAYTANASTYTIEAWLPAAEGVEESSARLRVENALVGVNPIR